MTSRKRSASVFPKAAHRFSETECFGSSRTRRGLLKNTCSHSHFSKLCLIMQPTNASPAEKVNWAGEKAILTIPWTEMKKCCGFPGRCVSDNWLPATIKKAYNLRSLSILLIKFMSNSSGSNSPPIHSIIDSCSSCFGS